MNKKEDTCVCIPTLNEEDSISDVINSVKSNGFNNIIVIDGGSTDETIGIVRDFNNVKLHKQQFEGGKGAAVRESFEITDEQIIVFIDADKTYEADHIPDLVSMIADDGYDHAIADRFNDIRKGAMSKSHIIGNKIFNKLFAIVYGENCKDILTGLRAINRDAYNDMTLESDGFEIETEMMVESVKNNHKIGIKPSIYYKREGESKLNGVFDGGKIAKKIITGKL